MPRTRKPVTPAVATASNPASIAAQVVEMRNVGLLSWAAIGNQLGFAPRTARRYYQQAAGTHQHHAHLPGKGGRYPVGYVATGTSTHVGQAGTWVPAATVGGHTGTPGTAGGALAPAPVAPAAKAPRAPRKPKAAKA